MQSILLYQDSVSVGKDMISPILTEAILQYQLQADGIQHIEGVVSELCGSLWVYSVSP